MEGAQLGIFMAVALWLALVLEHPRSVLRRAIAAALLRRFLFGLGIGVTVVLLIYSTWGRQSGAHFNPAVTLAMLYLQRIQPWDAFFYIVAQFIGGLFGVLIAAAPFRRASAHKDVNYVVTEPGKPGVAAALAAEVVISFILMATLRWHTKATRLSRSSATRGLPPPRLPHLRIAPLRPELESRAQRRLRHPGAELEGDVDLFRSADRGDAARGDRVRLVEVEPGWCYRATSP